MSGVQCNDQNEKLNNNDICCGGIVKGRESECVLGYVYNATQIIITRCKMTQADTAFMFLTAIVVAGAAAMGWVRMKGGY